MFVSLCVLLSFSIGTDSAEAGVESKIISAVSDGAGWFKFVNGVPKAAVIKANFTDKINSTGHVKHLCIMCKLVTY